MPGGSREDTLETCPTHQAPEWTQPPGMSGFQNHRPRRTAVTAEYDPRYLAGLMLFNEREFFEAHEVWEDLWGDCAGPERRFYQGLIQAAVALHHYGNGNVRGATKLFRTGRAYMEAYGSPFLGLDVTGFWAAMGRCFAPILADPEALRGPAPEEALIPTLRLDPEPAAWPDLAAYRDERGDERRDEE